MVKKQLITLLAAALLALNWISCKHTGEGETNAVTPKTPVTVAEASKGPISETITLNATSVYQRTHIIKAFIAGYVNKVNVVIGQSVKKGEVLFTLTTKEAAAYNSLNIKDTSFLKPTDIVIRATADGIASSVAHQSGEYAQEGDEMCTIADPRSMVFVLELPYELHRYAAGNDKCIVQLPDGKDLQGYVSSLMPRVDNASQTQNVIIKCPEASNIPENLVATILLQKSIKQNALLVPKEAVLSNESQSEFWVMKMINDSTAVKEIVKPGIRNLDRIELLDPSLKTGDKVLTSGNYGLSDTALVKIAQNPASE